MQKIDSHVHFWQLSRGDYTWIGPHMPALQRDFSCADFSPLAGANAVEGIILVQAAATVAESRFLLEQATNCSCVRAVVGRVDIENPELALSQLESFATQPLFCGIRPMLEDMQQRRWLELPQLDVIIEKLIALDLNFECMVRPAEFTALRSYLNTCPQLRAVLSHGGMPDIAAAEYSSWAEGISELAVHTQLYCKLSGLLTLADEQAEDEVFYPYVQHLLDSFGYQRLIWGSDWPVMLNAGSYRRWCNLCEQVLGALPVEQQQAIYVDNARTFYRLPTNTE